MKNNLSETIILIAVIALVVLSIFCGKFIFELVVNSNLPDWVKWMILK